MIFFNKITNDATWIFNSFVLKLKIMAGYDN